MLVSRSLGDCVVLVACLSWPAPVAAQTPAVALEPLFGVAGPPTAITHAGDGTGRLFVATQDGNIVVYDGANVSPFLTVPNVTYGAESGLLGLAFHPDYRNNGFFYVFHVEQETSRITRYQVSATDPNRGESASARLILGLPTRGSFNHRGGALAFGPDGYRLWIDGQRIIDNWEKHALTEDAGAIALEPGRRYSIRLEHFEKNGAATMKLLWSSPSQPKEIVPQSQLYP